MLFRVYTPLLLGLCVACGSMSLAQAAVYFYRDAGGQRHFTNDVKTIPARYRSQAQKMRQLEPAVKAPPPATTTPARPASLSRPQPRQPEVAVAPQPHVLPTAQPVAPSAVQAQPVDTHKFGLLQLRMTPPEVLQRLGPPQYVLQGRSDYRHTWYYPASGSIPSTRLTFTSGHLTNVSRGLP